MHEDRNAVERSQSSSSSAPTTISSQSRCDAQQRFTSPSHRNRAHPDQRSIRNDEELPPKSTKSDLVTEQKHDDSSVITPMIVNCSNRAIDSTGGRHRTAKDKRSYDCRAGYERDPYYSDLPLEWWERGEDCKKAKSDHMDRVDDICASREHLVYLTTLWKDDTVLEPNMFPYDTPPGIEHYTLWSVYDLSHREIQSFVDRWLARNFPHVRRWQYDDNCGERSIDIFHVHVFIEMKPFSFTPRPGLEYFPPHCSSSQRS